MSHSVVRPRAASLPFLSGLSSPLEIYLRPRSHREAWQAHCNWSEDEEATRMTGAAVSLCSVAQRKPCIINMQSVAHCFRKRVVFTLTMSLGKKIVWLSWVLHLSQAHTCVDHCLLDSLHLGSWNPSNAPTSFSVKIGCIFVNSTLSTWAWIMSIFN